MLRSLLLAMALLASTGVHAANKVQIAQDESVLTLRVDGELAIDAEGRVAEYRIRSKIDPQIQKLLAKAVPAWRFQPILLDGTPVAARSPMRITLAATEVPGGYEVRVDNVVFRANARDEYEAALAAEKALVAQGRNLGVAGEPAAPRKPVLITSLKLTPPQYPAGLQKAGVEGVVLLNLRLNPDGTVAEVFASQSSLLNVKGRSELLDRARAMLERNASAAAAKWTFKVDAGDPAALKPDDLTVRVPVDYLLGVPGRRDPSLADNWRHEFRGPNYPVPWLIESGQEQAVCVSDLAGGEFFAGTSSFRLSDRSVIGSVL
jgi:TonB family protein